MHNFTKVLVTLLSFGLMVGYNGFKLVQCLWTHRFPSTSEILFAVITVLVMYIIANDRN